MSGYELDLSHYEIPAHAEKKKHVAWNKGKPRSEWMSAEKSEKCMKIAIMNLKRHRRSATSGVPLRPVVALTDEGEWTTFKSLADAGRYCNGVPQNVGRCCSRNAVRKNGNTDHAYMGLRWYFDNDNQWLGKARKFNHS